MSDNTTTVAEETETTETAETTNSTQEAEKIKVNEYLFIEKNEFEKGNNKGFSWWVPQFTTAKPLEALEEARSFFTRNSKSGKDGSITILALLNSVLSSRFRSMATAQLLDNNGKPISNEERAKKLEDEPVLFSQEDAKTYAPERDSESVSGYTKMLNELKKSAIKAKNENKMDLARELAAKWKETKTKLDELIAEQQERDEKLMAEFAG